MKHSWLREHSLSIALGIGFFASTAAFFACEPGGHAYDFWNAMMGGFGGNVVLLILARKFYERGADPTKPAEECNDDPTQ